MAKTLKISAYIISTIIILIILGAIALTTLINPNDFKGKITAAIQQNTGYEVNIDGNISWSFFPHFGFNVNKVSVSKLPGFMPQDQVYANKVNISLKLLPLLNKKIKVASANITNAQLTWTDAKSGQKLYVTKLNLAINPNIDLNKKNYLLNNLKITGNISNAAIKQLEFTISGDLFLNLQQQTFTTTNLKVKLNNAVITGKVDANNIINSPKISGNINIKAFNPKEFLQQLGLKAVTTDNTALTSLSGQLDFSATTTEIIIPQLNMTLDQSKFSGKNLKFDLKNRKLSYNLNLNNINLNRYQLKIKPLASSLATNMPQQKGKAQLKSPYPPFNKGGAQSKTVKIPNTPIPVITTKSPSWNTQGKITIGQLTANRIYAKEITLGINSENNIINLNPVTAQIYAGTINARAQLNTISNTISATGKLNKIDVGSLINAITNKNILTGTANASFTLNTKGKTSTEFVQNLSGKGYLNITNGTINGIDINYYLAYAKQILNSKKPLKNISKPAQKQNAHTVFNNLTGTFFINRGIMRNNDLLLTAPTFQVTGSGSINLVKQQINYKVSAATIEKYQNNKNQTKPLLLPISIVGSLTNPRYIPDFQYLINNFGQRVLQNVVNALIAKQKGAKHIKINVGDILKQTLGTD